MRVHFITLKSLVSFLLLTGILLIQGCATMKVEPPSVNVADIRLQDATLLEQRYRLQLRIQNPNPTELLIDGLSYEVEINGKPFAKGLSNRAVTVPRYGSELIEVEGTSTLFDVLRQLVELPKGQAKTVQYHLKGKLGLHSGSRVPFDYQGEIELPKTSPGSPSRTF